MIASCLRGPCRNTGWPTVSRWPCSTRRPQFGKVSYTIDSRVDKGRITVELNPPARKPPKAIVLCLRHPEGTKIQSVSVDGTSAKPSGNGTVTLEGLVRPARIEVGLSLASGWS